MIVASTIVPDFNSNPVSPADPHLGEVHPQHLLRGIGRRPLPAFG
jgi:hypothetical protein